MSEPVIVGKPIEVRLVSLFSSKFNEILQILALNKPERHDLIAITQAEAEEPEVKEVKEPQVAATVLLMGFHDHTGFVWQTSSEASAQYPQFNLLLCDDLSQGWCSTEDLKEEPQVPGVVEALALCFFSSSQPFPPQHPKYMKLWQAEQSERFPVLDLPGNKKCWSQRLWEDFFSQAKFHLVRWRCLWLTDL